MTSTDLNRQKLTQLRKLLIQHFSLDELRVLCFDLGLEYEDLPGSTRTTKMHGLIEYLNRRNELFRLLAEVNDHRLNVAWPSFVDGNLAAEKDEPAGNPQSFIHKKTRLEMLMIPAGEFLYGEDRRLVFLPNYWISKTPVTNDLFSHFVLETGHEFPEHWKKGKFLSKWKNHPVVYVSWYSAMAYAKWAAMQLPTEQQWEKAARGKDGREYPWGNEWKPYCNTVETGIGITTPLGYYSPFGNSPYDCIDMSGNVWEWTCDSFRGDQKYRVLKGGSWNDSQKNAKISSRNFDFPYFAFLDFGFRLVTKSL